MGFSYERTIHFPDTDAAGVVFFARYYAICHEAYEESLAAAGIALNTFFGEHGVVIPIARSEAAYLRPLLCGDRIRVDVSPVRLSENTFAIDYVMAKAGGPGKRVATVRTEHVCITAQTRERAPLPDVLVQWLNRASGGA